jgi:hypothetical protein
LWFIVDRPPDLTVVFTFRPVRLWFIVDRPPDFTVVFTFRPVVFFVFI